MHAYSRSRIARSIVLALLLAAFARLAGAQQNPNKERGFNAERVYEVDGLDSVNTYNGNLIVTIPIGPRYHVNGALTYGLALVYNGVVWDDSGASINDPHPYSIEACPARRSNAGNGWSVSLGRLFSPADDRNQSGDANEGLGRSWEYESPDGASHVFDFEANTADAITYVMREPSAIRMRKSGDDRIIEFPDGRRQTFHNLQTTNTTPGDWRITRMEDRFSNVVEISYDFPAPTQQNPVNEIWTIRDYPNGDATGTALRTQKLYFVRMVGVDPDHSLKVFPQTILDHVDLQGYGGATSSYAFHYERVLLPPPGWDRSSPGNTLTQKNIPRWMLTKLDVSATGESYGFAYRVPAVTVPINHDPVAGSLERMRLPSGGSIGWSYAEIHFQPGAELRKPDQGSTLPPEQPPAEENDPTSIPPEGVPTPERPAVYRDQNVGVVTRSLYDENGTALGTWTYDRRYSYNNCYRGDLGGYIIQRNQMAVAVVAPDSSATITYYSNYDNRYADCPGDEHTLWKYSEFAKPVTHWLERTGKDGQPLGLSGEVVSHYTQPLTMNKDTPRMAGVAGDDPNVLRTTYARYEEKELGAFVETANATVYDHDKSCGNQTCYSEEINRQWDGLGHFAVGLTWSNFTGGVEPLQNARTTYTKYIPPPDARYMADLVAQQCTSKSANFSPTATISDCSELTTPRAVQRFCYDLTNGFMTRRRTQKGDDTASDDIISAFASEMVGGRNTGNVATESYHGASDRGMPAESETCSALLPAARYTIAHEYQAGAEIRASYAGTNFYIVDQDIDASTGLVKTSRDSAGAATIFDYDVAGRLKTVTAPATAPVAYTYQSFVESTKALPRIDAVQDAGAFAPPPGAAAYGSTHEVFLYDALGRVVTHRSLQPDDTWNIQRTEFDIFGRTKFSSVAAVDNGGTPTPYGTHFTYDQFGRVTETTAPDDSIAMTTYAGQGVHELTRSSKMYTGAADEADIPVTERYSATGRLVYVKDPAGPVNTAGEPTLFNETSYGYDVADRLSKVLMTAPDGTIQTRTFTYNNLGFLDSETFPEHGPAPVDYQFHGGSESWSGYDARGHLLTRSDGSSGAFDLRFAYDAAERLRDVDHVQNGVTENIKHFDFFDANDDGRLSKGKLSAAVRHNRLAGGDVVVTEGYTYDAVAGRVEKRATTVSVAGTDRQTFTQQLHYSPFGNLEQLTYPQCAESTPCAAPAGGVAMTNAATNITHNGRVVGIAGWADDYIENGQHHHGIEYHPSGLVARVAHTAAGGTSFHYDEQIPDARGIARPKQIIFRGVCTGPPVASSEPADAQQPVGQRVTLSVTPPATATSYQWYSGVSGDLAHSQAIAGATSNTYLVPLLTTTSSYWVRVGDATCSTDSRSATVTVPCSGVSISAQPVDAKADGTGRATFTIAASPSTATIDWYQGARGDVSTHAGSGSVFITPPLQTTTSYWARVTASGGSCVVDSTTVVASVCSPLVVVQQPIDATINVAGGTATISASVAISGGQTPYTFTWSDETGAPLATEQKSEATSIYSATLAAGSVKKVRCTIQDGCGHSVATNLVTLSAPNCDFHVADFGPQLAVIAQGGQGLELSVIMSPEDPGSVYTYEWFKDDGTTAGQSLGSSTSPTHFVTTYSHDSFFAKVTKTSCSGNTNFVLTPRAYVRLYGTCPLEPVTVSPAAAEVGAGGSLTLSAFSNWPQVRYDWYRGALGDTSVKLSPAVGHQNQLVVDATPATYWLRITNECGQSLDSNLVAITRRDGPNSVCDPIIIRGTPADPEIASGAAAIIGVDANSVQGITQYQWRQRAANGNSDISIGGSSPSIEVHPTATTIYSVVMTSACGTTATSRDIYVHVTSCGTTHFTTDLPATLMTDSTTDTPLTVATSAAVAHFDWYAGNSGDPKSTLLGTSSTGSFLLPRRDTSTPVWVRATTSDGCSFDSHTTFVDVCALPAIVETADVSISTQSGQYRSIGFSYRGTSLKYEWFIGAKGDVSQPLRISKDLIQVHPTSTTKYWVRVSNRCGSVDSPNFIVSVCPLVGDPTSSQATVMPNGTVQLSVTASGSDLAYHWYRGHQGDRSNPLTGNTASITSPAITAGANTFWVEVASGSCGTLSNEITIPICESLGGAWAIATTNVKKSQTQIIGITGVATGAQATFYAGPVGNVSASTPITGPSLSYAMTVTPAATTTYWVRLAADNGICTTDTAPLTINVCIPQITTQPQPPAAPIAAGATAHLTVVSDLPGSTYEWYGGQTLISTDSTSASIDVQPSVDTTYFVRVIGTCGVHVDSAPVTVTICKPPVITAQPVSTNASANATALSVTATGTALSYQWYQGAAGTTSNPLGTPASISVNPAETTDYWVRVSGSCGSVDSSVATVSVCPTITAQPVAATPYVQPGASTTITVAASGAPLAYHWYIGPRGDISQPVGTNSATLNTGALTATTTYWVAVWSGSCQTQSQLVTVNVCNLSAAWNSALTQVKASQQQTLSLTGTSGLQATFYKGTAGNVAGSTIVSGPAASYSVAVAPTTTTTYWARLTDPSTGCFVDTTGLTITICIPTITAQPQPQPAMVNPGGSSTMTVAADIASTYQWYSGSSAISGATNATYVASPSVDTTYHVRATGACGFVDSQNVTVTVCKPPVIASSTPSTNAIAGGTPLTVAATGTALTYQWYQGASGVTTSPISAATGASTTVNPSQTTSYWVKISGTCGSVNSPTITVSVCPTITAQPVAAKSYVQPGTSTTITVTASGNPISYQWYIGAPGVTSNPVGTNSATLTTAALSSATTYWVAITSGTCMTGSQAVTVNVCNLAVAWGAATTQVKSAQSQTLTLTGVPAGDTAVFYTGAVGNVAASTVIGGPTTTYSIVIAPTATTTYWVRVTDPNTGCYADTAALTINVCIPQITQQPQSVTITSGASTTLQVATDVTPATYQWYSGTTALTGKTAATLSVTPTVTTSYWVRVTGACSTSIDSATATVTVCQPAAITGQPADAPAVQPNMNASLGVTATGTGLSYQWYVGNSGITTSPVSGATSATLTRNVSSSEKYWVRVTGSCGASVNSNSAWLSVYPAISTQPAPASINPGSTVVLTVQATGAYLHYQWFRNDTAHPVGTDSNTYSTGALTTDQTYFVRVASGVASTISQTAAVTMCTGPSASLSVQNSGACKTVFAGLAEQDLGNTTFRWFQGQKGDMSQPVSLEYYFQTCQTNVDYWVRLTNVNTGCYTDTDPIHVY